MPEDIQKTPSSTPNFKTELAKQLQELVPESVTDGKIDVTKLKELLGDDTDDGSERFGLFWPGKLRAIRAAQEPTTATLTPEPKLSKDWDTTKNVFIEGDNLEALKILQKHYHGAIKMIYIDPPYNTGHDFIYPDNYKEGLQTYLEWTKQVNEEGQRIKSNPETDGRYHSHWLDMMYPRLKLARSLLTDDGVIFISIDDNEQANLKKVCDEIFGEGNFIGILHWKKKKQPSFLSRIAGVIEYLLVYERNTGGVKKISIENISDNDKPLINAGNKEVIRVIPKGTRVKSGITRLNAGITGTGVKIELLNGTEVVNKRTVDPVKVRAGFRTTQDKIDEFSKQDLIFFTANLSIRRDVSKEESGKSKSITDLLIDWGQNQDSDKEQLDMFGKRIFSNPKPILYLKNIVKSASNKDSLILDFFSGSATTAHAVMQLNAEDGGSRRHIQVQLPEPVDPDSPASKAGFKTIADIARKRIDLAGEKIKKDYAEQLAKRDEPLDIGYRTYKLTDTNFAKWHESSTATQGTLEEHLLSLRDSANDNATELALLTETLLKQGYSLTEKVEKQNIGGLDVYSIGENDLALAYMNESVKPSLDQLRALVDREPEKLIVLEDAFQGDDELKTNLVQLAKTKHVELWTA